MEQYDNESIGFKKLAGTGISEDERSNSPHERFCNKNRTQLFNYHADIFVRLKKLQESATISFAVDGLDLKYDMDVRILPCRRR
jgi:hypothetical protein